ncbi:ASCH domain-containing protein [Paenibacillus hemerocallicola]|uniref:ASCH domain-containing protein n=1 Tax=Paenibacillus hemerocallicola TaxID=1172614 RepID=A0A5C4THZ2_9BACL|nr:ASCH domain-containing protein [Paenibacillus hemerocallicola]TNJ68207.1 ASCH domain-containing protein [Paenibacillus hemerocallicola]
MKAITIIQPWATLIAIGAKHLETRSWPTKHRGTLAIHAGKKVDREACEREPIKSTLAEHGFSADNLPTGAVVATCNLSECWSIGEDYQSSMPALFNGEDGATKPVGLKEGRFGNYETGRHAWELTDIKQLPELIPAKGRQGLWNWTGGPHL